MKLSDLEDSDLIATKIALDRLENKLIERFNTLDARVNALDPRIDRLEAKIDRVSRTIWIPALAAIAQLLFLLFHK